MALEIITDMKTREIVAYPPAEREFAQQRETGLEHSGAVVQQNGEKQAEAQFLDMKRSNIRVMAACGKATLETSALPTAYTKAFTALGTTPSYTLPALHEKATAALRAVTPPLATDAMLAFAHIQPVNQREQAFIALQKGTLAILVQPHNDQPVYSILYPEENEIDRQTGFALKSFTVPSGATLLLGAGLEAFAPRGGITALATTFAFSKKILEAAQGQTMEAYDALGLPLPLAEHILGALISLSCDQQVKTYKQNNMDLAFAAAIAREDLTTLLTNSIGKPIIPNSFAFIASRVSSKMPQKDSL